MSASRKFSIVGGSADDLPEYPISSDERLDSHYFIQWNLKRWRNSDFRDLCDPEVGWYGFNLICEAAEMTPLGTLPIDERILAKKVSVTVTEWRELCSREISPLHGWYQVRCDDGSIRLAHAVVTEVMQKALASKTDYEASKTKRKISKQMADLEVMLRDRIGASQLLNNPNFLSRFNDFLCERYPNNQRREQFVREVLNEFLEENG